ncbi:MAG: hypothetical protein E6J34_08280 [Chloroflexi bacterium]|nr:MAG: hypothetical protein E6J34_08280 [Chloroflexota bacterium]
MSSSAYQQIMEQVRQLELEEQIKLLQDILQDLSVLVQQNQLTAKPLHSILELEGLGKEIWEGIDVDQYIEEERNSWDG